MAVEGELAELSLQQHRQRAREAVDRAIGATVSQPWNIAAIPEVRALRDAPPDELRSIVIVLLDRASGGIFADQLEGSMGGWTVGRVLGAIGKRPAFTRGDTNLLLTLAAQALRGAGVNDAWIDVSLAGQPVAAAERAVKQGGVGDLRDPIKALADTLGRVKAYGATPAAKHRARLLALLAPTLTVIGGNAARVPPVDPSLVDVGDAWGRTWRANLAGLSDSQSALFSHCSLASGVVPSAAWRKRARELVAPPDATAMAHLMLDDVMASARAQTFHRYEFDGRGYIAWDPAIVDGNVILVRGAMWAAATVAESWVDEVLVDIGLHFGTSGGSSNEVRDERLANTAAAALGTREGPAAIAALGRMKAKVGNRNVSKQIDKALAGASERAGISPSELLELAVPTHGLDSTGRLEIPVGDHVAVAAIDGDDVRLTWRAPDGTETASPPAAIGDEKAAVTRAKEQVKELRKALGIERGRVEELFTEDREWVAADWRARYLDHPLTGSIGRRLVWSVSREAEGGFRATVMAAGDRFQAADGSAVTVDPSDRIRLWHPIDATEDEIAAWRAGLVERQVRQPFKQAFREVYVLTPAEEETERFSNRFAGHYLRYSQARALMLARRWATNFLGPFDGGYNGIAKREFRSHRIRADFWHDAIEEELAGFGLTAEHCVTEQVRFVRLGRVEDLMLLHEVPPIVFSEAMRDVDLFVSVTSIGADTVWPAGGEARNNRLGDYWRRAWDEPLASLANVRRDALERLIPGLSIADRLELRDRWLVVRGDLRTYRIHLGSANILMEPADTYLCIVPNRGGAADKVFLPFDDDPILSVILSKAFLLARDAKITDRSIATQIRKG